VSSAAALERVGSVLRAVAAQALRDRGLERIALLDDGGPEAALAARLLGAAGEGTLVVVSGPGEPGDEPRLAEERRRFRARLVEGALTAHPVSKTVLLLSLLPPPEPLLPLADLWATEVEALQGAWSAPADLLALAGAAGGVAALDCALRAWADGRRPDGLDALPEPSRSEVRRRLLLGAAGRRWPVLVPKLGPRTVGADLHE
jgi:hypothetical protein